MCWEYFLIVVKQYSQVYNQTIAQYTIFEVQILKKPKLKDVVRNIKLIFIKEFFLFSENTSKRTWEESTADQTSHSRTT